MNKTAEYRFTIIVPLYNEKDNLQRLGQSLASYAARSTAGPTGVLFVDDGSTDSGGGLLAAMCADNPCFHYLRFTHNCGLSAALKAGFDHCESPLVGYIDADLQTDPEDFDLLLPYLVTDTPVTKEWLAGLGNGGLCLNCPVCHFPNCGFGKGA